MITAKVKNLGAQAMNLAPGAPAKTRTGNSADSFQNVFNRQTDSAGQPMKADKAPAAKTEKQSLQRQKTESADGQDTSSKKVQTGERDTDSREIRTDGQDTDTREVRTDEQDTDSQEVGTDVTETDGQEALADSQENVKAPADGKPILTENPERETQKAETDALKNPGGLKAVGTTGKKELLPEECVNAAMEAVMQLIRQIADAFGMAPREVEGLMQEMGIERTDLLSADKLGSLILEASGAKDTFELVTDGELYQKFRQIMEAQSQLAEAAAENAGVDREVLPEILSETVLTGETVQTGESAQTGEVRIRTEVTEDSDPQETAQIQGGAEEEIPVLNRQEGSAALADEKESGAGEPGRQIQGRERREASHEHTGQNPVLNQLTETGTLQTAQAVPTESVTAASEADTQNIMRQIMEYMKVQVKPDVSSLEMQLHPASLGTIQVQLASKGGAVTAQFIAQSETVKAALETQMIQLQESFEEQGIRVEAIEVSVQTRGFEQNLEDQGRERGGEQPSGSRGRRRIRLDAQLQPEELTADERLAADMMKANGGTVDYTA